MINLHTHTHYSDGSDIPENYITAAISKGFTGLGFSDHSPLPFDNTFALREEKTLEYCNTILGLKEKYSCKTDIFLGMEVDFIPGTGHRRIILRANSRSITGSDRYTWSKTQRQRGALVY